MTCREGGATCPYAKIRCEVTMVREVNMIELQQVLQGDKPVLIDFWAPWCRPCTMLMPVIEDFGSRYASEIEVIKVNIADYPDLASVMEIVSIPNLQCFRGGKKIGEKTGFVALTDLEKWLRDINAI